MKRSIAVIVAALGVAACSGGDDETAVPATDDQSTAVPSAAPSTTSVDHDDGTVAVTQPVDGDPAAPVSVTDPPIVELSETGVPGLDSDDAFCAAWSRFGGSWQVLAVGSSFLDDPVIVAGWEVVAAPVIASAYDELVDNMPPELSSEAADVADGYFGVLARRSAAAGQALTETGASPEVVAELGASWVAALAVRDPFTPNLELELGDEAAGVVAAAGEMFASQRVEFHLDPSMIVTVDTPLTDAYLETACPDQGTLSGQEVESG